ncbi:DUF3137 domain-containing protein [Erythrobacter crassostreae]|uniref:DUF3137 domain-containing protein n=1 Tax=Erythrobacter crassostreae TaxID=2828328 RepID=A0A9X1F3Z6_9SPHN|nr:DUF3137 domain-containing protein [Erythrobacter crassostrea]MBV7259724.1 DUF3137 domain-containing protein [Erythrobacter crassostrea]
MRADIQGLMGGELGDWLQQQSAMRADAKESAHSRWTWGSVVLLPLLAFMWFGPDFSGQIKFFLSAGGAMGVGAWGYMPINAAKKTIKIGINSAIARSLGVEYAHEVEPGGEFEACRNYGLVPSYDRSGFEDRWFGDIEGHGFELYEAHLEERRGSGKNRRWVTVFRGAIIAMEFGRPFHSTTLLQRAGKHKKWFGLGGRKDNVTFGGHQLDYVDQVHPDFEDVFEIWSDDQVEARVLVHPSYVEHLLAVEKAFQGEAVRALFARGSFVIAIESNNLFESGSLNSAEDEARVAEAAEQFTALAGLALAINQNERGRVIGKMDTSADLNPEGGFGRRRRSIRR